MSWADTYEEREEYLWAVHHIIPRTAGMWGQPMFTMKYTSCEDPTRDECGCVAYNEKRKDERGFSGIDYALGAVWSEIMSQNAEDLMSDSDVDMNM